MIYLSTAYALDRVNILMTHDINGLNTGVFSIRMCQWAVDLFAAIVSFQYYRPDVRTTA